MKLNKIEVDFLFHNKNGLNVRWRIIFFFRQQQRGFPFNVKQDLQIPGLSFLIIWFDINSSRT